MTLPPVPAPDLSGARVAFVQQRAASGMTFDQLADASGLSRRTLLNVAAGETTGDLRTWLILARVWDISLDELLAPVWR